MSSDESPAVVELPDDAIEHALVEGFGQARWDAMNGAEQHEARDLFGPMAASIAARVRAEAPREAAEKIAPNQVRPSNVIIVGARMTDDVLDMVRTVENALVAGVRVEAMADERVAIVAELEAAGHLAAANLIAACGGPTFDERIAEAVADERQRIASEVEGEFRRRIQARVDRNRADGYPQTADAMLAGAGYLLDVLREWAAGSVRVATPGSTEWAHVVAMPGQLTDKTLLEVLGLTDAEQAEVRGRLRAELDAIDRAERGISFGPVATPEPKAVLGPGTIVRRVATPTEPAACSCDGAVYHSAEENARRQPFIVDPACPVHGARSAAEWTASALAGSGLPAGQWAEIVAASPVPAVQPAAAEQVLAARAEQALVQEVLDAHDDELGTGHGAAYRAMVADHWRLIETFEPHRTGARAAFDRRPGEEEAQAELLGHRLAVGEAAEQPEER